MGRPRKKAAEAPAVSAAKSLQDALSFCSVAFKEIGPGYSTHAVMHGKCLYTFDGVLAAGHPIDDDLTACPHAARLRDALARPGTGLGLALAADGGVLGVSLGGFRARVPCLSLDDIAPFGPDPLTFETDSRLQEAFGALANLAANSGTTVLESSLLLDVDTLTATNRKLIMQYWHGLALPRSFVIPRPFATALWKCPKLWAGMGWSDSTLTVHFRDGAWLRTQLYAEPWPDIEKALADMRQDGAPLPADFFDACDAVLPFAGADVPRLFVLADTVATSSNPADCAASQECRGLPLSSPLAVLPANLMKHIAGRVSHVDWTSGKQAVHFYGDNMRCAMMRYDSGEAMAASAQAAE